MLEPTIPGWKVETLGDDIAWMRFGEDGRLYARQPRVRPVRRRARHRLADQPQRDAHHRQGQLGLHQRRAHRRRRHLVGGHDRRAAGPPHRLEGPRLDARVRRAVARTPTAGSARRSRSARSSPRSTTTRAACRSRRSSSAAGARRRSRWSPRPATGSTASSWARRCRPRRPPPRPARSASCAATRWRCCRSSATTPATTSATGSTMGKERRRRQAAEDLLRQLVPPRRRRRLPLARLRREQPGAQVGRRADRGHARPPSRRRSATCRRRSRSTSTGLDLTAEAARRGARGRRRRVARRDPADPGVVRQDRRDKVPDDALDRARRPQGAARLDLSGPYCGGGGGI